MEPILYIMAILGCADSEAECREVRLGDTAYASAEACQAAAAVMLGRSTDLDFPVIEARCRAEKAESARLMLAKAPRG